MGIVWSAPVPGISLPLMLIHALLIIHIRGVSSYYDACFVYMIEGTIQTKHTETSKAGVGE